jgi:hypothetical protein
LSLLVGTWWSFMKSSFTWKQLKTTRTSSDNCQFFFFSECTL